MRAFITTFLIVLLTVTSAAYDAENQEGFPKGPVKQAVKTYYSRKGKLRGTLTWTFNRQKQLIQVYESFPNRKLKGTFTWTESGNVKEAVYYINGEFHHKQIYRYDNSDRITQHFISWDVDDVQGTYFKYDRSGQLIEYSRYDENDNPVYRVEYDWDDEGNRIDMRRYNSQNQLHSRTATSYYSPNQIREETIFDGDGNTIRRMNTRRYSKGNIYESYTFRSQDSSTSKRTYQYNESGRKTEIFMYVNDELQGRKTYEYKNDGKTVIRVEWDAQGEKLSRDEITHDDRGNAIEQAVENELGEKCRTINRYDEENRLIQSESRDGDRLITSLNKTFNREGDILLEKFFIDVGEHKERKKTVNQYDSYGNMTESLEAVTTGDSPNFKTERRKTWTYSYFWSPIQIWITIFVLCSMGIPIVYIPIKKYCRHQNLKTPSAPVSNRA